MEKFILLEKCKKLSYNIYELCEKLPIKEQFIIIPQILKASISVASNIAEGSQRGDKEYIQFLKISRGSLYEVIVQLEIINHVYGIDIDAINQLCIEISKMNYMLIKHLENKHSLNTQNSKLKSLLK